MIGLAKMCWLAALYRATPFVWDRAVDASQTFEPAPRELANIHRCDWYGASAEYYRLIDDIQIARARVAEPCDHDNPMSLVTAADGCSLECPVCHEIIVEVDLVCIPVTVMDAREAQ